VRRRLLTALILAPIVLAFIFFGGPWVTVALLIVITVASYELSRVLDPLPFLAALTSGAPPVLLAALYGAPGALAGALLGLPIALCWLVAVPEARTLRGILALFLMSLWVGVPLAHLGLLDGLPGGNGLLLAAVVGPWISDAGAYFAGRLLGRHKLFPVLSPKKTYEGAIGGLLLTVAAAFPFAYLLLGTNAVEAALLGVVVSVASQAGDLFESVLKRMLEIKDLGNLLPGHGGILDRVDSLLFTAPAVYYLYVLLHAPAAP
jgi:phosphatidate cytidylyltransferase